jgi:asparagine synthase (glutamine-hydrolysing)
MLAGLSALGVPLHWNRSALRSYLQLGWFPAPETAIHEVSKLLPGERLTVAGEQIERARTELPSATQLSDLPGDNTVDRLDRVLTEVVESQLVADVPVGVFLSGGVDSSLLTALAGKIQPGIKTFSVGFQGSSKEVASADESEVARQVAEHLGTEHHTFLVDPAGLLERLADAWTAMDEPIVDAAVLPLLIISQAAREHVKVCLSGDGGDEVFGGYPYHWLLGWKRRYHRSPRWVQGSLGRLASWLPQSPSRGIQERLRKAGVGYRLIAESDYSPGPFAPPHDVWLQEPGAFRELTLAQLCDDDWYFVDGLLHPLAGQMLPKSDRVSMFASIELRVPLLDNRMLAFGRGLSFSEKVHAGVTKAPLRQLLARYVPEAISRRPKHGFRVPLSGWFRDELKTDVAERLAGGAGIPDDVIAADAISRLVDEHASGRAEHSVRLWALMTLSDWMKRMGATATIN